MTTDTYEGWIGRIAVDLNGEKIGVIADIYYDDATDQPEWITVRTGILGTRSSFVPLHGADRDGENLLVPYDKAQVKDAPNIDSDGSLTPDEERTLYDHYGRGADLDTDPTTAGTGDTDGGATVEHVTSDPGTDDVMPNPEEASEVGIEHREPGRARLRRYIGVEQEHLTVPVERDEVGQEHTAIDRTESDRTESDRIRTDDTDPDGTETGDTKADRIESDRMRTDATDPDGTDATDPDGTDADDPDGTDHPDGTEERR